MTHYRKLVVICFLLISTISYSQNNVLVIDYNNNFSSDQSNNGSRIYNRLVATQTSVTRIASIPPVISTTYDEVWIFGNMGVTTATNLNPVVNYINSGGAVYVQSEVSCCNNEAAFADNIINAVAILGPSITHFATTSQYYQYQTNPILYCPSSAWDPSYGAAIRPFYGTPPNNVLFEVVTGCSSSVPGNVVGVQFSACDMISGQGAFISNGDFNIFPNSSPCNVGIMGTSNREHVIDLIANLFDSLLICSPFCSSALPVELLDFYGEKHGEKNKLFWTTSTEVNNDYFTLEKSLNAEDFKAISKINGAGNSNTVNSYSIFDENPSKGINYYRLKQTDYDGTFSYSKVISIENNSTDIFIYPNPTTDYFTISGIEIPFSVKIVDLLGRVYLRTDNQHEINTNTLATGTYIVVVSKENSLTREKITIK